MKRYILTISLAIGLGLNLNAQSQQRNSSDGFFTSSYSEYREEDQEWGTMPLLPGTHGSNFDYSAAPAEPAPIGSGLLILTSLGLGYAAARRKK